MRWLEGGNVERGSLKKTGVSTRFVLSVSLVFCVLVFVAQLVFGAAGSTSVCTWKGHRQAAYSYTIDDTPTSNSQNVPFVLSVTMPLGIPLTWYVITAFMYDPNLPHNGWDATWADPWVAALVQAGHELGSHTVNHPDNPSLTPTDAQIRAELRDSKAEIEQMCPANGKCLTIAYSSSWFNQTIANMTAEYYIAGRGGNSPYNQKSPALDPWNNGAAGGMFSLEKATLGPLDPCIADSGWYTDFIHGISDNSVYDMPTADFTARMNDVYSRRNVLWAATERDIAQYVYERNASTAQLVSANQSQIVLNLTHSLNTTVCDFTYPITLKTEVYPAWDGVTVTQGSNPTVVKSVNEAGKQYVYFDARPNQGQITLSDAGAVVASPVIAPSGGLCSDSVAVTMSMATTGAAIYYTTSGANPTASSTPYTGAFFLKTSATVKAIGIKSGMANSPITSTAFTVLTKPSAAVPYQINCGGSTIAPFTADSFFTGGADNNQAVNINLNGVINPAPAYVYQTQRNANFTSGFSYALPGLLAGTGYTVRLHFAETNFTKAGDRMFNVSVNGQQVLNNFDIFAAAGGANKAVVREFLASADNSGKITIQFTSVADNAVCSGIEVLKGSATSAYDRGWNTPAVPGADLCPNPLTKAADLVKYLQAHKGVTVRDLSGKSMEKDFSIRPGIYLLEQNGKIGAQKVIVIK
jgi:hypothetical protein